MSGFLDRMEQQRKLEVYVATVTSRQETADFAAIALHEAFGFGPERLRRFMFALNDVINANCDLVAQDTKDHEYAVERTERALRAALGPYYVPRDVRFGIGQKR